MCEGGCTWFFHHLTSKLKRARKWTRRTKFVRALLEFLCWMFGSDAGTRVEMSDEIVNEIMEHENETNFIKNFVIEDDRVPLQNVKDSAEAFLLFCVGEYFDLDEMIAIDSPFLDRLLFTLFKCSLIDILQDQEIDLFIRDTIRNGEVVERIYKSLTIAYVLKKAADHFSDKHQVNLTSKYKELSSYYEKYAETSLEKCRQASFTSAMDNLNPSNPSRPSWSNICMQDIAFHGKFTEFLSHRTCVIAAGERWETPDDDTGIKPSTARRAHVFSHLLFVALFTVIMLSMNRIEFREKKYADEPMLINKILWLILRLFLLFWKIMFITQTVMTFDSFSGSEVYTSIAYAANILIFMLLLIANFMLQYYKAPWHLYSPFRVLYDITFLISYVLSTLIFLRHFTADRFYGSVVRLLSKMSRMLLWFVVVFMVFWFTYSVTVLSLTGEAISLEEVPWKVFTNGAFEIFADMKEDVQEGKITKCEGKMIMSDGIECLIRSWLIPLSLTAHLRLGLHHCVDKHHHFVPHRLLEYQRKPSLPPPFTFIPFLRQRGPKMNCFGRASRTRKRMRCCESSRRADSRGDFVAIPIDYPVDGSEEVEMVPMTSRTVD
ncbi:hypothetical protein PRIPAC_89172 [Pristionchus pacificus]|uniref:Uncharacterized protein n=1 Tax=Pristionchus pacificus TaxID=54126 RepID=A0A2A6CY82_PRIPA|nr:hypothetical protein PRIPAC_89172 [Pristionchus pacificus]|eukprot:PDM83119.1 hypothetical protein PRIPAC_37512 [Pristionchus pacificus]